MKRTIHFFTGFLGLLCGALFTGCGGGQSTVQDSITSAGASAKFHGSINVSQAVQGAATLDEYKCSDESNGEKVLVCHVPDGNPSARHEICIARSALKAHINCEHGSDTIGPCKPAVQPSGTPSPGPSSGPYLPPPS